jgi:hypothetical protein
MIALYPFPILQFLSRSYGSEWPERPRRRAAEQRDELAAFHCSLRPVLATGTVAHTSMRQETAALRNFYPADDRCGS